MPSPFQIAPLPHGLVPDTIGAAIHHAVHLLPFSELPKLQIACMTIHPEDTRQVLEVFVAEGHVLLVEGRYVLPGDLIRIAACMEELNTTIGGN